jgi:two-component system NarL family sensor kinase
MSYRAKLLLLTLFPIALISALTLWILNAQGQRLAQHQSTTVENLIIEEKQQELRNYLALAQKAIEPSYNSFLKTKRQAQSEAKEILREMSSNEDQYFFVIDGAGTVIVDPRLSFMQGKNWIGMVNKDGQPVFKELIENAKNGKEFYTFVWQKPSTKEYLPKLSHSIYFERWDWVIGTGIYLDDIDSQITTQRNELLQGFNTAQRSVGLLAIAALIATSLVMWAFQFSQQRMADAELRRLNQRLVDVQEGNRKRVSQELHDGISQLLVSSKYGLEAALDDVGKNSKSKPAIASSINAMDQAISEVRRISLDLRPTILDDVGLAAALNGLGTNFEKTTQTTTEIHTVPVGNLLSDPAKIALYRIAQEALTNIIKHANAHNVGITLTTTKKAVKLLISDDGNGFDPKKRPASGGLGLTHMRERIDSFGGKISITSSPKKGCNIHVSLPITGNANDN